MKHKDERLCCRGLFHLETKSKEAKNELLQNWG